MIEVRGRVVDPDGRPVAGAAVQAGHLDRGDRARPRGDQRAGRPVLTAGAALASATPCGRRDAMFPWVVASAPGFGPGWASAVRSPAHPGEMTIRLVEDGPPIEGRIVDLEGRPVAGARVKVERIWFARKGRCRTGYRGLGRRHRRALGRPRPVAGDDRPPRPTPTADSAWRASAATGSPS